jgi:transposase
VLAVKALGKSMTRDEFMTFLKDDIAPKLWKGARIVMDNMPAHKVKGVAEILESVGAKAIYSAPYSPEFNLIEHLWWSLKLFILRFISMTS